MKVRDVQTVLARFVKGSPEIKEASFEVSFIGPTRTVYYEPKRINDIRYTPDGRAVVTVTVTPADKIGDDR
jgi:hypothetical protein